MQDWSGRKGYACVGKHANLHLLQERKVDELQGSSHGSDRLSVMPELLVEFTLLNKLLESLQCLLALSRSGGVTTL